ncbi:hypothetical protein [Novosphingobium sp. TH158]|uniref:hypothetical protein n=1 Tax=Novosphingobium sp. TH158 TaxID=2067455 RepID=UPI000C7E5456|nr:hypothetical protein [Novosphingobium sp. TH158]PLK26516.1 hypothetical protein C0V78_06160 [Novosphingobium sp. TH158]
MANEMPPSSGFTGLSQSVIAYSEAFTRLTDKAKAGPLGDADWAEIEGLVNTAEFIREGVFLGPQAEVIDWPTYRYYVTQFGGHTSWEGTLRRITETPGRVILELEERNTRGGETDVSNTVTIYEFDEVGKLRHLDVYVMPLRKQPA